MQIGVLFLVVQILMGSWAAPFAWLDYQVRKDYIAEYLCVNKSKPLLNCNGKCFLAKKLNKANEERKKSQRTGSKEIFTFYQHVISEIIFADNILEETSVFSPAKNKIIFNLLGYDIFHPPRG